MAILPDFLRMSSTTPMGGMQAPSLDSLSGVTGNGPASLVAPMQAPKKPGAFSKDGAGWKVLGILGDALAAAGGQQGTYMPAMLDLQKQTNEERKWQSQLAQQLEVAKMKANDPGDDAFTRALRIAGIPLDSPQAAALARKRADMLTNPVQLVDNGMGGKIAVRPNETAAGPQPGQVEDGYQFMGGDPSSPQSWKQVGGGAGNGIGGFPGSY